MLPGRWYWQLVFSFYKVLSFQETVASHLQFNISVWGVSWCCCYRGCHRDWGFSDLHEKLFMCSTECLRIAGEQSGQHGGVVVGTVAFDCQQRQDIPECCSFFLPQSKDMDVQLFIWVLIYVENGDRRWTLHKYEQPDKPVPLLSVLLSAACLAQGSEVMIVESPQEIMKQIFLESTTTVLIIRKCNKRGALWLTHQTPVEYTEHKLAGTPPLATASLNPHPHIGSIFWEVHRRFLISSSLIIFICT